VTPTTYAYDQASRLTRYEAPPSVAGDPAVVRDYSYDGDGLRGDLLWGSTGGLPLVVGDSAGLYVTGPDGLPLTQLTFDAQQRYYHHDQLGSTRAITNAAGTTTARYTFDPYGNPAAGSSTADSRFGFAGQYTDRASGLIYMRARWYDPATAQFITADPIGLDSGETNLYRYAGGDPANLVDPSGLLSIADVSNFASGVYDELTFGATRKIREFIGSDGVDYCSGAYHAGGYGGMAAGMVGPGGIVRGAGKAAAKVAHHVVPIGPGPENAWKVLDRVTAKGAPLHGYKGGGKFANVGKGMRLPESGPTGPITYREWDVNPNVKGVYRGEERLVTGSDGSAYSTRDHYDTFVRIR
jgi:RHS repeat-associated protein